MTMYDGMHCCESCGRDTRARGPYCSRCIGLTVNTARSGNPPDVPLEDDYGDESDADSICDDNPGHPHGKWISE